MGARSRRLPNTSGDWTTTHDTLSSICARTSSCARTSAGSDTTSSPVISRERAHDLRVMGMQPAREDSLAAARDAMGHQHGLAAAGRAVVHGGVRNFHAGEVGHLRLELEQHLQRALRDFRLVGRVARQKFRALDEMVDARGHMVPVSPCADEERRGASRDVARGHAREHALDVEFALAARQIERRLQQLVGGHVGKERVDVCGADAREHILAIVRRQGQIAQFHLLRCHATSVLFERCQSRVLR